MGSKYIIDSRFLVFFGFVVLESHVLWVNNNYPSPEMIRFALERRILVTLQSFLCSLRNNSSNRSLFRFSITLDSWLNLKTVCPGIWNPGSVANYKPLLREYVQGSKGRIIAVL